MPKTIPRNPPVPVPPLPDRRKNRGPKSTNYDGIIAPVCAKNAVMYKK